MPDTPPVTPPVTPPDPPAETPPATPPASPVLTIETAKQLQDLYNSDPIIFAMAMQMAIAGKGLDEISAEVQKVKDQKMAEQAKMQADALAAERAKVEQLGKELQAERSKVQKLEAEMGATPPRRTLSAEHAGEGQGSEILAEDAFKADAEVSSKYLSYAGYVADMKYLASRAKR